MKKRTIYANQSQELLTLFEEAENSSKIMCVPIDYAKKDHVVMFCNGNAELRGSKTVIVQPSSSNFKKTGPDRNGGVLP